MTRLDPLIRSTDGCAKIPHQVEITEGAEEVGRKLCEKVKSEGVQTLILGNTGKSTLEKLALGSVSEYCLAHADCAIVIVK